MAGNLCFLFGHADAPQSIAPLIRTEIEHVYNSGTRLFIVGHYGSFDQMAAKALHQAKQEHPDMVINLLTPWHPAERPMETPPGFDGQFYPPLEHVPRRFSIVRANQYVLDRAAAVICYVNHFGNTRKLLERAQRKCIVISNIAEKLPKNEYTNLESDKNGEESKEI